MSADSVRARLGALQPDDEDLAVLSALVVAVDAMDDLLASLDLGGEP